MQFFITLQQEQGIFIKTKVFLMSFKILTRLTLFTLNLFELALQSGVKRLVVPGSCFEYGLSAKKRIKNYH